MNIFRRPHREFIIVLLFICLNSIGATLTNEHFVTNQIESAKIYADETIASQIQGFGEMVGSRMDGIDSRSCYRLNESEADGETNILGTVYSLYNLTNKRVRCIETTNPYVAISLPDSKRKRLTSLGYDPSESRGAHVVLKINSSNKPSFTILHHDYTKILVNDDNYYSFTNIKTNTYYLIYTQEVSTNKWWVQGCELKEF